MAGELPGARPPAASAASGGTKIERVISRPMTVPAERSDGRKAEDLTTCSTTPGSWPLFLRRAPGRLLGRRALLRRGRLRRLPGLLGLPRRGRVGARPLLGGRGRRIGLLALRPGLVSCSYAESRSIAVPYSACNGDAATAAATTASDDGAISDCGARIRVHATGVGAPFSDSTVTTASPVPSDVSSSSRS